MSDKAEADPLIDYLHRSDLECPVCRYALRGLATDRCPECGTRVRLQLVVAERPGSTWWLGSVICLALAAFLPLVMAYRLTGKVVSLLENPQLPQLVQAGFVPSSDLPNWSAISATGVLLVVMITLFAWAVFSRREFAKWSPFKRVATGILCALSPLGILGLLALVIQLLG